MSAPNPPSAAAVAFVEATLVSCPHAGSCRSEPDDVGDCKHCLAALFDVHLQQAVDAEREACALIAGKSKFDDGHNGTIEGQIAAAIRSRR